MKRRKFESELCGMAEAVEAPRETAAMERLLSVMEGLRRNEKILSRWSEVCLHHDLGDRPIEGTTLLLHNGTMSQEHGKSECLRTRVRWKQVWNP